MLSLLALSLPIAQAAHADYTLEDILALKLPVITIETVDSEEPTCVYVNPPEGMAGYGIRNATKVPGRLTITLGDEVFYDSGSYEKNVSGMRIKIRGNSSAYPQKKPYKVKLEVGDDLLLRGNDETYSDKDWLLIKDSDLRQCIGYETCRLMGMEWTPGYQYVNVVMNGDYRGLYLLCEPVERNTHCRINVSKTGYIAESDAYFWNEDLYIPSFLNPFGWTFKYPDADDITGEQFAWLTGELTRLEETLSGDRYAERIDVESFARWLLTHDILGTWDSYGSNLFIARYDTLDSKVRMPVLWDFDTIFRMEGAWANVHRERFFFHQMLASVDDTFRRTYRELWNERRNDVFEGMLSFIEEFAASEEAKAVDASMRLDAERWRSEYHGITEHLDMARSWFEGREAWLDEHIATEVKEPYRILDIGNSYTDNYTELLNGIAEGSGIDIEGVSLYKLTRSSGSFRSWPDCYYDRDDQPCHFRRVLGAPVVTPDGDADPHDGSLMRRVLTEQTWDLIVLHQRSEYAHLYDQWTGDGDAGHLDDLLSIIHQEQPDAELGFHIIHSYADWLTGIEGNGSLVRWQQIAEAVRRLAEERDISVVIPCGTAVESLREQPPGNSADYASDGSHLASGLGKYTAACTYFEAVIAPLFGVTVLGNPARYACTDAELASARFPEACVDVTDENATMAQQLAVYAVADPYGLSAFGIDAVPCDDVLKNGPIYNVWGIPVSGNYTGIMISGGRKFIQFKDGR